MVPGTVAVGVNRYTVVLIDDGRGARIANQYVPSSHIELLLGNHNWLLLTNNIKPPGQVNCPRIQIPNVKNFRSLLVCDYERASVGASLAQDIVGVYEKEVPSEARKNPAIPTPDIKVCCNSAFWVLLDHKYG